MDFGSVGFKGFGKTRALELPDGASADRSPAGRLRLRYNPATGTLEQSVNGAAYTPIGGSGASALSYVAWVDERSGNDGTATFGDINLPFATVQAAVTAAIASTNSEVAIAILPGNYQEDVVIPATVSAINMGIMGVSGLSTIVRSITINLPGAGIESSLSIQSLILGNRTGGGQTVAPFTTVANDGFMDVFCADVSLFVSTPDIDLIRLENDLVFGFPTVTFNGGEASAEAGATVCRGCVLENGNLFTNHFQIRSSLAPNVLITGFAAFFDVGTLYSQLVGTASPIFQTTAGAPFAQFYVYSPSLQPALSTNDLALLENASDILAMISGVIASTSVYSGDIVNVGTTLINFATDLGGNRAAITGGGTVISLQGAELVAYDSTTVLGSGNTVEEGIDWAIQGVSQTAPVFSGGGTIPLALNAVVLYSDVANAVTFSLPDITTVPDGKRYRVVDINPANSAGISIAPAGSDTIGGVAAPYVMTVGAQNYVELMAVAGTTNWEIVALRP